MEKKAQEKKTLKKKLKQFIYEIVNESELGAYKLLVLRVIEAKIEEITDEQLGKLLKTLRKKIDECLNDKD
jgi:uncharacterized protein (DUF2267 family)